MVTPSSLSAAGVLDHGLLSVRGDDADLEGLVDVGEPRLVGSIHGAGVKADDLIVVQVRDDVGTRRRLVFEHANPVAADAVPIQPLAVGGEVVPHGGEDDRILSQQAQIEGDVRRGSAEALAKFRNVEGHVQHANLLGQDDVPETTAVDHDGVDRDRARAQNRHRETSALRSLASGTPGVNGDPGVDSP